MKEANEIDLNVRLEEIDYPVDTIEA
ncbi:hypothetical protein [Caldanaerobius polysaccharolyticus]|nr:hypothetical protein [Caldanaerobius polysaccharolyticus]